MRISNYAKSDLIKDIHVFVMSIMLDTAVGYAEGKVVGLADGEEEGFDVGISLGRPEGKLIEGS